MKVLKVLFAILLSIILFFSQAVLLSLFVADRLISPSVLTKAIEGAGLMDSIVEDMLSTMGVKASGAEAAPLNAYAGRLSAGVVTALVRGGDLPKVDVGEVTTLLTGVLSPALGASTEEAGALSALLADQLAAELNGMLTNRTTLAVALGISPQTLSMLEALFSPMARVLLAVAVLLFGMLLVFLFGKRKRVGRTGLIWWSVTAALSGAFVLLCGIGMNAALRSALDADTVQFVTALQKGVGGAFTLFGIVGLLLAAALLAIYFATKPKRRKPQTGRGVSQRYA